MKKKFITLSLSLLFMMFSKSFAHCEVPCGIYDDELRIHQIKEYILTIERIFINSNIL